jgi:Lysozyme like domain
MAVYTYAQMEQLWIQAGGPKALAPLAAAIGEAESGGNSDALNPNDNNGTQSSFGIWQISNGTHAPPSPSWANPAVNAQLAVGKWKGAGEQFTPWGTFDSGAYKAFLSGKIPPDQNVPGSPTQLDAQTTAAQAADCLIGNPLSASIGIGAIIPGASIGGSVGPACLFTKSNARAFIGTGLMMAGGAGMFLAGAGWILKAAGVTDLMPVKLPSLPNIHFPGAGAPSTTAPAAAPASAPPPARSPNTYASSGLPTLPAGGGGPKVIQGQVLSSSTAAVPALPEIPAIAA